MGIVILLKRIVHGATRLMGIKISRRNVVTDPDLQLLSGLSMHGVSMVIDVGANNGQFALNLIKSRYKGKILSIEPQSESHKILKHKAKGEKNWMIAQRCAAGEAAGETTIHVSGNSVSSSILPMLRRHSEVAEDSKYVGKEHICVQPLDCIVSEYIDDNDKIFVKIDTQGYEWQVLNGANSTLSRAVGVICELSLTPLYDGQKLWLDISTRLEALGFELWGVQPGFSDPSTGQLLQIDGIFFRKPR